MPRECTLQVDSLLSELEAIQNLSSSCATASAASQRQTRRSEILEEILKLFALALGRTGAHPGNSENGRWY